MDFEKWQADSVAMSVDFYGPFIHDLENKIFVVEHSGNAACQISPLLGLEVEKQIVRIGEMEWESDGTRCDFTRCRKENSDSVRAFILRGQLRFSTYRSAPTCPAIVRISLYVYE